MKLNYIGLATMLAFAVFATARTQAQPPPPVEGKNIGSPMEEHSFSSAAIAGDVQEQVEILRRLLKKSFEAVYGPLSAPAGPFFAPGIDNVWGGSMGGANPPILYPRMERSAADLEGVYLKDYGVVYTVTLPPPPNNMLPGPTSGVMIRTPLSPWERTRKELRGEKIKDESKPVGGSPPLSEVILKVLADNGKNFTGLAEGERITVVVTFRDDGVYQPQPGGVPGMPSPGGSSGSQRMPLPGGSGGLSPFINPTPAGMLSPGYKPPEPAKDEAAWMTDVRNSLTLGDLHVKQQNIAAAIAAYNKAQEQLEKGLNAEKDAGRVLTAAHLCLHLARGYDSAGDNTSARKATQKVGSLARMAAALTGEAPAVKAPPVMTPPTLPGKLIVTASKKLLDEVGYGKMTFEAFSKAATVEYVKPSADKK